MLQSVKCEPIPQNGPISLEMNRDRSRRLIESYRFRVAHAFIDVEKIGKMIMRIKLNNALLPIAVFVLPLFFSATPASAYIEGVCRMYCDNDDDSSSPTYSPPAYNPPVYRPSPQEIERQRRYAVARQYNEAGLAAFNRKNFDEAISYFEQAYNVTQDPFYLAQIENAKASLAIPLINQALNNNDLESALRYAELRLEHAQSALRYARSSNNSDMQSKMARGVAMAKADLYYDIKAQAKRDNGNLREAIELWKQALVVYPGDRKTLGYIADAEARIAYSENNLARAIAKIREAAKYAVSSEVKEFRNSLASQWQQEAAETERRQKEAKAAEAERQRQLAEQQRQAEQKRRAEEQQRQAEEKRRVEEQRRAEIERQRQYAEAQQRQSQANALAAQGQKFVDAKNYAAAIKSYEAALKLSDNNGIRGNLAYAEAMLAYRSHDLAGAIAKMRTADGYAPSQERQNILKAWQNEVATAEQAKREAQTPVERRQTEQRQAARKEDDGGCTPIMGTNCTDKKEAGKSIPPVSPGEMQKNKTTGDELQGQAKKGEEAGKCMDGQIDCPGNGPNLPKLEGKPSGSAALPPAKLEALLNTPEGHKLVAREKALQSQLSEAEQRVKAAEQKLNTASPSDRGKVEMDVVNTRTERDQIKNQLLDAKRKVEEQAQTIVVLDPSDGNSSTPPAAGNTNPNAPRVSEKNNGQPPENSPSASTNDAKPNLGRSTIDKEGKVTSKDGRVFR